MVTVDEARQLIRTVLPPPREEELALTRALGRVNVRPVSAAIALPLFDNSAMDGFAIRAADVAGACADKHVKLEILPDVFAGDAPTKIGLRHARRIMTGAPMPSGADAVIPIEVARTDNRDLVVDQPVPKGLNVRFLGEEIAAGESVLEPGAVFNPGTIGFFAALGIARVRVYRKPRVAIVSTGSELIEVGNRLGPGKIYDSNGPMLCAALDQMGIRPVSTRRVQDRPVAMRLALASALARADVVLVSGGVSEGRADYAKDALKRLGVETVFWGVRQKPGKPLYFGKKGESLVFGLPGNPASVFTCFYEYVYPALRRLSGFSDKGLLSELLPLNSPIGASGTKSLFLKARRRPGPSVELLSRQGSHMLSSLREADSFVVIPEDSGPVQEGGAVLVHSLPYAAGGL